MPRSPDRCFAVRIGRMLVAGLCLLAFAAATLQPAWAADTPLEFADPAQQARYQKMIADLRCLVCQNQTLADSEADLAQDLREQIYERMNRGDSDKQIIEFLLDRYGDFVLYNPPLQENTWVLWFGPFVLLAIAIAVFVRVARMSRPDGSAPVLTEAEQKQVEKLMAGQDDRGGAR